MTTPGQCLLCAQVATAGPASDGSDNIDVECQQCGWFRVTRSALSMVLGLSSADKAKARGWIYEQNSIDVKPVISSQNIPNIRSRRDLKLSEQADRLLLLYAATIKRYGDPITQEAPGRLAAVQGESEADVGAVSRYLYAERLIDKIAANNHLGISSKGHARIEQLDRDPAVSAQGFVAMWFNDEMRLAFDKGFEPAIVSAGYTPMRIDRHEHVNKIDDEIIAQIRRSRFLIADFTGHRGGVYFEAGFALGLGLPVIWTCRKDHLQELHFDVRQYNCIDWKDASELADRLRLRIEAAIGDGPMKSA